MLCGILQDVRRLVSSQAGLAVNQDAVLAVFPGKLEASRVRIRIVPIGVRADIGIKIVRPVSGGATVRRIGIVDSPNGDMILTAERASSGNKRAGVNFDPNAEIIANLADQIAKVLEATVAVGASIDHDDGSATTANELVDAKVFEMPAVRQKDVIVRPSGTAKKLTDQPLHPPRRAAMGSRRAPWIAEPPAEPRVKDSEQCRHIGRRMVAHVWADGGARNCHGGSQFRSIFARISSGRAVARARAPAIRRGQQKRLGLAFLPGEVLIFDQIQRRIDERIWASVRELILSRRLSRLLRRCYPQPAQPEVIASIQVGDLVGHAIPAARGAQVTAHQPMSVEFVQREPIRVDEPCKCNREEGENDGDA